MHFKDVVQLHQLVDGDRFYLLRDGKKVVYVLLNLESKRTSTNLSGYTYQARYVDGDQYDKKQLMKQRNLEYDYSKYVRYQPQAEKTQAVFLRHEIKIA